MQSLSCGEKFCNRPTKCPLLRILWWLRVAPLGNPVVPLVYWMLIASSHSSDPWRSRSCAPLTSAARAFSSPHVSMPATGVSSRQTMVFSAGSLGDWRLPGAWLLISGASVRSMST